MPFRPAIAAHEVVMPLNHKRQLFVEAYVKTGSAKESAIAAGYAAGDAANSGYRLLKHPDVASALDKLKAESEARTQAVIARKMTLAEEVVSELRKIALSDSSRVRPIVGGRVGLIDTADTDPDTRAAIAEVSETVSGRNVTVSVKMHPKVQALALLARISGLLDRRDANPDERLPDIADDEDPPVMPNADNEEEKAGTSG